MRERLRRGVARVRLGVAAIDVPGELIEHEDQREPAERRLRPVSEGPAARLFDERAEPRPNQLVEGGPAVREPLAGGSARGTRNR